MACHQERLSKSSQSSISTAISAHWLPFIADNGLGEFVPNGDPKRGGIAASFAIYMARKELAYGTIQGYIWGWEQYHINNGFHSPLDNVQDWSRWMRSLEVQIFRPSEPTEMVPFLLLSRSLLSVDRLSFAEVRTACAMLMLFFTMSRSEYPVPKTHSGQHNFNPAQHCRQRDVRTSNGYVEWAFGIIKQDQLGKRLRKGEREWKPVGNATGCMNMRFWLELYCSMRPANDDLDTAFFVTSDGLPLLYHHLLNDMRLLFCKVQGITLEIAKRFGLHGLRVLGYNAGRAAMGEDVAALQGGWFSSCHQTYGRDTLNKILSMAQAASSRAADLADPLPRMPLDPVESVDLETVFSDSTLFSGGGTAPPPAAPSTLSSMDDHISKQIKGVKRTYSVYFYESKQYPSLIKAQAAQKVARRSKYIAALQGFGYSLQ